MVNECHVSVSTADFYNVQMEYKFSTGAVEPQSKNGWSSDTGRNQREEACYRRGCWLYVTLSFRSCVVAISSLVGGDCSVNVSSVRKGYNDNVYEVW